MEMRIESTSMKKREQQQNEQLKLNWNPVNAFEAICPTKQTQ